MSERDSINIDDFVRDLTAQQRRIYAYIRSLVWNAVDADDVLQNTNKVLWVKRADFAPGTDFGSWAVRVAHFEVLAYRSRKRTDRHIHDDKLLSLMAESAMDATEHVSQRQVYLDDCIEELPETHRTALRKRYEPGVTIADLARAQGRSVAAISQLLFRIRSRIMDCIEDKMANEECR